MRVEDFTEHFSEDLSHTHEGTNFHTILEAFMQEVDCTQKEIVLKFLNKKIDEIQLFSLDRLFGFPLQFERLPVEAYEIFDLEGIRITDESSLCEVEIDNDKWEEIFQKDASYRERIKALMKAIQLGGTVDGIKWAYRAATGDECEILENFRYRDQVVGRAHLARPATIGDTTIYVNDDLSLFPPTGGIIEVQGEEIAYTAWSYPFNIQIGTLTIAIPAAGPILSINVNTIPPDMPRSGKVKINSEIFSYGRIEGSSLKGILRAQLGTVEAAHIVTTAIFRPRATAASQHSPLLPNADQPSFTGLTRGYNATTAAAHPAGVVAIEVNPAKDQQLGKYDPNGGTEFTIVPTDPITDEEIRLVHKLVDRLKPAYTAYTIGQGIEVHTEIPINGIVSSSDHYEIEGTQTFFDRRGEYITDDYAKNVNDNVEVSSEFYVPNLWEWRGEYSISDPNYRIYRQLFWARDSTSFLYGRAVIIDGQLSDGDYPYGTKRAKYQYWHPFNEDSPGEDDLRPVPNVLRSKKPPDLLVSGASVGWESLGHDAKSGDLEFEWMEFKKPGVADLGNPNDQLDPYWFDQLTHIEVDLPAFQDGSGKVTCYVSVKDDHGGWQSFGTEAGGSGEPTLVPYRKSSNNETGEFIHEDHTEDWNNGSRIPYAFKFHLEAGTNILNLRAVIEENFPNQKNLFRDSERVRLTFTNFRHKVNNLGTWGIRLNRVAFRLDTAVAFPLHRINRAYVKDAQGNNTGITTHTDEVDPGYMRHFVYNPGPVTFSGTGYSEPGNNNAPVIMDLGHIRRCTTFWIGYSYGTKKTARVRISVSGDGLTYTELLPFTKIADLHYFGAGRGYGIRLEEADALFTRFVKFQFDFAGGVPEYHSGYRLEGIFINHLRVFDTIPARYPFPKSNLNDPEGTRETFWCSVLGSNRARKEWVQFTLPAPQQINVVELLLSAVGYRVNIFVDNGDGVTMVKVHEGANDKRIYQARLEQLFQSTRIRIEFDNLQFINLPEAVADAQLIGFDGLLLNSPITQDQEKGVAIHDVRVYAHIQTRDQWEVMALDKPVHHWQPEQAIDGNNGTFWESAGASTPDAIEYLILDVRDILGEAQRIDKVRVDPTWAGCRFNIYASVDDDQVIWTGKLNSWWDINLTRSIYRFKPIEAKFLKLEFYNLTGRPVSDFKNQIARDTHTFPTEILDAARKKASTELTNLFDQLDDFTWNYVDATSRANVIPAEKLTSEAWRQRLKNVPQLAFNWLNNNLLTIVSQDAMLRYTATFEELSKRLLNLQQNRKNFDLTHSTQDLQSWREYTQSLPKLDIAFPEGTQQYATKPTFPPKSILYFVGIREVKAYRVSFVDRRDEFIFEDDFVDLSGIDELNSDDDFVVIDGVVYVA